jgi:hypothetical protein
VAAEIVHDRDVAGLEERRQLLFEIGAEAFAVDWAVENAWRGELVAAQRTEKGQGAPVAMRRKAAQTPAGDVGPRLLKGEQRFF